MGFICEFCEKEFPDTEGSFSQQRGWKLLVIRDGVAHQFATKGGSPIPAEEYLRREEKSEIKEGDYESDFTLE